MEVQASRMPVAGAAKTMLGPGQQGADAAVGDGDAFGSAGGAGGVDDIGQLCWQLGAGADWCGAVLGQQGGQASSRQQACSPAGSWHACRGKDWRVSRSGS